jgi:pimeloyl-ACP methyl ester carboxylesterase
MTAKQTRLHRLADGRQVAFCEYGDADGAPVVYCHGFPSSRLEARLAHAQARAQGVRLLAIDRPGFGRSERKPGRRLLDWPQDVAALARLLGWKRYAVLGVSGGAPYAFACAVRMPEEVRAVAIVAGLGPVRAGLLPWYGALAAVATAHCPALARALFALLVAGIKRAPRCLLASMVLPLAPADRAVLGRPPVRTALLATLREAARQGAGAWAEEFALYVQDWGFDARSVRVPVSVWHGECDRVVAPAAGRALAGQLPNCQARFLADEGHYSLPLRHMTDIFAALRTD